MPTILIADDRPVDRDLLVTLLGYHGFRVLEAVNGEDALARLGQSRVDLVISDVMMPTMDGYELVRRMRADVALAAIPVLFYSATYLPEELEELAAVCGVHVLSKPSDPEDILAAVDVAIASGTVPMAIGGPEFQQAHLRLLTDKLVETQEHLVLAVRGSHVGLWDWDLAIDRVTVSPKWKALLGYGPTDQPLGSGGWLERVHDEDRAAVEEAVARCRTGAASAFESEHRLRHRDGSYRWMLAHGVCRHAVNGDAVRLAGAHVDITKLKVAEVEAKERARHSAFVADIALAMSEGQRLRDMLGRCARAMVQHLDAVRARVWTTHPTEPVFELQASEGPGTSSDERDGRIPIDQFNGLTADWQPVTSDRAAGDPAVPDQAWVTRLGLSGYAAYPLVLNGRLIGIMALFKRRPLPDSTQRALAAVAPSMALGIERRQLEESRKRFADLLEATPDFVTIAPELGPPLFINRAARRALGIGLTEAPETLLEFRPPAFDEYFQRVILPGIRRDGAWSGETE